jgi:outer membrane protein assembly factor BamB
MSCGLTSLNPQTGALNWEIKDLFRNRCVSSPVRVGDLVFVTAGNGAGDRQAYAVQPGTKAKAPQIVYKMTRDVSYVPTPIVVGNRLYCWGDNGIVTCYEAETGKPLWTERVGGRFFGSPVCLNGRLLAMSAQGALIAIEASDSFKLVGRMKLGDSSHATPAIASETLYLRTEHALIAIGGKKSRP